MRMKKLFTVLVLMLSILLLTGFVSAEKMWNFNNHTVNISDDLIVGGFLYGDGSYLTNLNASEIDLSAYFTSSQILGFNYWNDTFATFNKTYADTLYYGLNNPYGFYNSTTLPPAGSETDPLWTSNFTLYNSTWSSIVNESYYLKNNPFGFYNSTTLPASSGNPFDQSLNTTDNVTFNNLSLAGDLGVTGRIDIDGTTLYTDPHSASSVMIGLNAGQLYTNHGAANIGIGQNALRYLQGGAYNNCQGDRACYELTTGSNNIGIGYRTLYNINTEDGNTAIGHYAGNTISSGEYNVFLGYEAGRYATGSNQLFISNSGTATPLIWGNFSEPKLQINGFTYLNGSVESLGNINSTGGDICITGGNCLSDVLSSYTETDPLWSSNFTLYNDTWSSIVNESYYLKSNPFGFYNSTTLPASSGNPFDQSLNTTDDVIFDNVSMTGDLKVGGGDWYGITYRAIWDLGTSVQFGGDHANTAYFGNYLDTRFAVMKGSDRMNFRAGGDYIGVLSPTGWHLGTTSTTTSSVNTLDVNGEMVIGSNYAGVNTAPTDGLLVEGNVGINTTTPQRTLHVNGDILSNSTINATGDICIEGGNCLSGTVMTGGETDPLWSANFTLYNSTWSSIVNESYYLKNNPFGFYNSTTLPGGGTLTGSGIFMSLPLWNGTTSLNSSNIYQGSNGNIGIGTTTPKNTLNILGDLNLTGINADAYINGSLYLSKTGSTPYDWGFVVSGENLFIQESDDSSMNYLSFYDGSYIGIGVGSDQLNVTTNSVQVDNLEVNKTSARPNQDLVFNASTGTGSVVFIIG